VTDNCIAGKGGGQKGKGSPCSIAERRVPELIPVLGSQPAGDASQTWQQAANTFRQARSYPRNPSEAQWV